jgi:predicted phosphodiesterase
MKQFLLGLLTAVALAAVLAFSRTESVARYGPVAEEGRIQATSEAKNPWTGLKVNIQPEQFQFAIVSDRTGGHREKVFSRAVQQINLLQPEFVMSVGDLIEGYTTREEVLNEQWNEFDGYVKNFGMPFFYVPGNHDVTNKLMVEKWAERYGRRFYHFVYKDVLFLCLDSDDPPGSSSVSADQHAYLKKALAENPAPRWTFVFLHKPIWTARDLTKNGWLEVEKLLAGRNYTVFCGHVHRYQVFQRNGMQYYQLATTGGGSRLRGPEYGEFDQIVWVTMKKDKPVMANVLLEGVLPMDLKLPDSDEKGVLVKKKLTYPTAGKILLDGQPLAGATVAFHLLNPDTKRFTYVCDGLTDANGRFQVSTYSKNDGCPAGEYVVTVVKTGRGYSDGEVPEKSLIPERYQTPQSSPLKVTIKEGTNDVNFELNGK